MFTDYTESTDIILNLGTDPEDRPDLDDDGFKSKFDENATKIKAWLNGTHLKEAEEKKLNFVDDTASKTLALTDAYKKLRATHTTEPINYTVPPNTDVEFPIGTWIIIEMTGVAQVAVVEGAGVTINPSTKLKVNGQNTSAVLVKEAENTWSFQGSVKA